MRFNKLINTIVNTPCYEDVEVIVMDGNKNEYKLKDLWVRGDDKIIIDIEQAQKTK